MSAQDRISRRMSLGHDPVLARYRRGGVAMRKGPADAPFVSIKYGASGIAYAIYRLARLRGEHELFDLAGAWVKKAFARSSEAKAYYDPDVGITSKTVGHVSLFHSVCGLHCVDALVRIGLDEFGGACPLR
jgi:eukaryotic-like serine/threonine-protein kinase